MGNHTLTTQELKMLVEACGGLRDFPVMTHNACVNYVIDCITGVDGDDDPPYDAAYYEAEAARYTLGMTYRKARPRLHAR